MLPSCLGPAVAQRHADDQVAAHEDVRAVERVVVDALRVGREGAELVVGDLLAVDVQFIVAQPDHIRRGAGHLALELVLFDYYSQPVDCGVADGALNVCNSLGKSRLVVVKK